MLDFVLTLLFKTWYK